jgi:hypothetical protein
MRPGSQSPVGSTGGFLGKQESLLDVLATDNDEVVGRLGLTHQELAKHMHVLGAIGERIKEEVFLYHGRRFSVRIVPYRGHQLSPFYDGTKSNEEAIVRNLDNGRQIEYSLLVPFMVERYGFYEGRGTPYRVDPGKFLEILDFIGKASEVVPQQPPVAGARQRAKPPALPATRKDATELVDVVLNAYMEGGGFFVEWGVKPRNAAHRILYLDLFVMPKGEPPMWNQFIAQHVSTIGQPLKIPPGVMLRGTTSYPTVKGGTEVELFISGEVQISDVETKKYSFGRKVVAGK